MWLNLVYLLWVIGTLVFVSVSIYLLCLSYSEIRNFSKYINSKEDHDKHD